MSKAYEKLNWDLMTQIMKVYIFQVGWRNFAC
jgi:hypothetical protein